MKYHPQTIEDFIGPARQAAALLRIGLQRAGQQGEPARFLLNGPPGIGKSELVRWAIERELQASRFSVMKYNGTAVGIDTMAEIQESLRLPDLYGWRCLWIDEADQMSEKAQIRWLSVSDDLPARTAAFFTSNCRITDFEVRFQRRFQPLELAGPSPEETAALLRRWVDADTALAMAQGSLLDEARPELGCCVGAALNDMQTALDAREALEIAA